MQVWFNERYSVVCHKTTSCGIPLYRLIYNLVDEEPGRTIDKGFGDEEFERLKRKRDELNKEA